MPHERMKSLGLREPKSSAQYHTAGGGGSGSPPHALPNGCQPPSSPSRGPTSQPRSEKEVMPPTGW